MTIRELWRQHSFTMTFLAMVFGGFLLFSNDNDGPRPIVGFTMGTSYSLQLSALPEQTSREQVVEGVAALLRSLDTGTFSTYAPDSELSRFNRHPVGEPFRASTDLIEVLTLAQEVNALTDGAFDVTVGPLVNLWGFGPGAVRVDNPLPDAEQVERVMRNVGAQFLRVDPGRGILQKSRAIYVDLSAIAKGYAADRVAGYLESLAIEDYFFELGGELKINGRKAGGESWVAAIEAPLDGVSQVHEVFYSHGARLGVAGSGDYRNFFMHEGTRYSHELDPRSGRPISHNMAAAFVIDESAARADALATAYMVLGLDAARRLIERHSDAAYLIYKSGPEQFADYVSAAFVPYLTGTQD